MRKIQLKISSKVTSPTREYPGVLSNLLFWVGKYELGQGIEKVK